MKTFKILFISFCFIATTFHVSAQEIWQSDMKVEMTQSKSGNYLVYEINISTDNDDTSRSPHLIFTLPRNSRVNAVKFDRRLKDTAYTIMGNASQSSRGENQQIDGYVRVDFPNLNRLSTTVRISIKPVDDGWKKGDGASAFIYSLTPELNKQNNFSYLSL